MILISIIQTETGIKRKCLVSSLPGFHLYWSFPIDNMHCTFINFAKDLWNLIIGKLIPGNIVAQTIGGNLGAVGNVIGSMELPANFGRKPKNPLLSSGGFRAEDWRNLIMYYLLPSLANIVQDDFLKVLYGLVRSIQIVTLCREIQEADLQFMQR